MTVASGVRPYAYNRDNFTLQSGETVGYSGILFEEPMFVLTAERAIYKVISEANRKFTKYINKGAGVSADFEPRADGQNLDGQYDNPSLIGVDDGPGNVAFRDYITDLRTALSGLLMTYITEDIDYAGIQALEDYLIVNSFPGPDGLGRTWTHPDNNETPSGLATSGALYDVDLREVQYQPYVRASKYNDSSGLAPDFVAPIIPSFISKAGGMVRVSAIDKAHANNLIISDVFPGLIGSGYDAADSGNFVILGDAFTVANSKLFIGYNLIDQGNLDSIVEGACQSIDGRTILEAMGDGSIGVFAAPALTLGSGIYGLHVFDNPGRSGLLGIWPSILSWRSQGFDSRGLKYSTLPVKASGVHVFNEGIWSANSSGMSLYSPINGADLWRRFADQETYQTAIMSSPRNWAADSPTNDPGSSTSIITARIQVESTADPVTDDEYWIFATYDKRTGALLSSAEHGPWSAVDPLSAQFVCGDMSDHSPSFGLNVAGYTYINAREGSDNFIRIGITTGSQILGTCSPSGFGTAIGSPEWCGTINGELVGSSRISPLVNPPRIWQLAVTQTQDVFPLPPSSGRSSAAIYNSTGAGVMEIMFEQELGHSFENTQSTNFSPTNNWRIIKGQGDFAGQDFMAFNATPKGETNTYTYLGAVDIVLSGGTDIVEISEMLGPFPASPHWIDNFTS